MSTDIERELERMTELRGFRYGGHDFVAHVGGIDALKKLSGNSRYSSPKKGLIDRKTKELAIIAACVALKDTVPHLQLHMHAAHKAGASPEEIMDLLNIVGSWVDTVARHIGLEAWRVTFRPDLPAVDRVVELR